MTDEPQFKVPRPSEEKIEEANTTYTYAMWSVFKFDGGLYAETHQEAIELVREAEQAVAQEGVTIRGWYDISGFRADADLMLWMHADNPDVLQTAYHAFNATEFGMVAHPVWSNVAMHRQAEFNRRHLPGFMLVPEAPEWCAVYPFIRSYEWYLLEPEERARILRDHGMAGRDFPDVVASTLAAFALGDYEWIVIAECDRLDRIVDMMRAFRNTEARLHVREDTPFFTGKRVTLEEFSKRLFWAIGELGEVGACTDGEEDESADTAGGSADSCCGHGGDKGHGGHGAHGGHEGHGGHGGHEGHGGHGCKGAKASEHGEHGELEANPELQASEERPDLGLTDENKADSEESGCGCGCS